MHISIWVLVLIVPGSIVLGAMLGMGAVLLASVQASARRAERPRSERWLLIRGRPIVAQKESWQWAEPFSLRRVIDCLPSTAVAEDWVHSLFLQVLGISRSSRRQKTGVM